MTASATIPLMVPGFGVSVKFWVAVPPAATVTDWFWMAYPEALAVSAYVPAATFARLYWPAELAVLLPPL